jgi:methionine synthase II (cobalamin-independent)
LSSAVPEVLKTTTIGSLPRFDEDIEVSLSRSIEFQRSMGLDLLADGEQRTDMISYFAESLQGLEVRDGFPGVTGQINQLGYPKDFTKVKDVATLRRLFPEISPKVAITGPTTLGMTCASRRVESYYKGPIDFRMYEDIAAALAPIAKALADAGAYVQIDEPFLSQGFRDLPERVSLLDRVAEGLPHERTSVHVCGYVGRFGAVGHLLRLEHVPTLSFAFAGRLEEPNIGHVDRTAFEEHGKKLGAGCISVTPMSESEVQAPEQVRSKLGDICGRVGRDNVAYTHPDCGLRATKKELVPIILRNMRAGIDLFG